MEQESVKADLSNARDLFRDRSFVFVPGSSLLAIRGIGNQFANFAQKWSDLPVDRYFTGPKPYRFRRHAQLDFNADTGELKVRPVGGYFQPVEYNPLFGGITRYFAPIEWATQTETVLTSLIRLAAGTVFGLAGWWVVNVHFVRITSDLGASAPPAPEGPHRDGYDFITLHLVGRNNDTGGETMILDQADRELWSLTLDAPLDTLYMDDRRFRHYVTPIGSVGRQCHRDMILMSYERPN
jgi:hypothetical protein